MVLTSAGGQAGDTVPPDPRRPRRRLAGVVAAVVIAAVALGVGALLNLRNDRPQPAPTITTSPSASVATVDQLSWAPPVLRSPVEIKVSETNRDLRLSPTVDYRIVMPKRPVTLDGGLVITGGYNVVLIGGEIRVPDASKQPDAKRRRGLYLRGQLGTIHVEGLKIGGSDLAEGIDLSESDGATVQLQNISVGTVHGTRDTNHADILQTWAGPANLRIDGLSGTTTYQGFFLLPTQFQPAQPASFDLRRVVLTATPEAGYLLWTEKPFEWLSTQDVVLVDPWAASLRRIVRPLAAWDTRGVRLVEEGSTVVLPAGVPGVGYQSPGYRTQGNP